jgi:uncharacterized protein YcnI
MRIGLSRLPYSLACALLALLGVQTVLGHITIWPKESAHGAREKYTVRVPNEKQVATTRIEAEFPAELNAYDFEFKPGWKIDFKKNDKGKIIGATWTGKIAPYEFVEFGLLGLNPTAGSNLVWKFVQYYEDGMKEEFTGPIESFYRAPVVVLKPIEASTR